MNQFVLIACMFAAWITSVLTGKGAELRTPENEDAQRLAAEVRNKGWIGYAARSERGDWDLFACRPDGFARRNLTQTAEFNEFAAQFSPDGQYVLITGNLREDGDPANAGAPMALMRLKNAPIICGESKELRSLHRKVNNGPVLILPVGWEPCWTFEEIYGAPAPNNGE